MINKIEQTSINFRLKMFSAFPIVLLLIRIILTGSFFYSFLLWNLILAWVPLFLSLKLIELEQDKRRGELKILLFTLWILFFPNSAYIITDFVHLNSSLGIYKWFDLLLLISFSWMGLILSIVSLRHVERLINKHIKKPYNILLLLIIILSCSFGIYLGRFERWNSWDIILHPFRIYYDLRDIILHPVKHSGTFGFTFILTAFLITSFFSVKSLTSLFNEK